MPILLPIRSLDILSLTPHKWIFKFLSEQIYLHCHPPKTEVQEGSMSMWVHRKPTFFHRYFWQTAGKFMVWAYPNRKLCLFLWFWFVSGMRQLSRIIFFATNLSVSCSRTPTLPTFMEEVLVIMPTKLLMLRALS